MLALHRASELTLSRIERVRRESAVEYTLMVVRLARMRNLGVGQQAEFPRGMK
jgi:hypothetical protein